MTFKAHVIVTVEAETVTEAGRSAVDQLRHGRLPDFMLLELDAHGGYRAPALPHVVEASKVGPSVAPDLLAFVREFVTWWQQVGETVHSGDESLAAFADDALILLAKADGRVR
ncbi:MAG TPA: hypothetical protein VEC57_14975 [Candidatus Limnocylindrales bacterium]|nr:hypothetical protein [Candidatus Limnocylindrales bacterium]